MPLYEYHCRSCDESFQRLRLMADADAPLACPRGHHDVARALSLVAPPRRAGAPVPAAGGGCCGGGCGCAN